MFCNSLPRRAQPSVTEWQKRLIKHLPESTVRRLGIFAHGEENVKVHRDEPVFDGQFSNRCYREAVKHFHSFL